MVGNRQLFQGAGVWCLSMTPDHCEGTQMLCRTFGGTRSSTQHQEDEDSVLTGTAIFYTTHKGITG
ncbi:hypothetical protein DT73_00310 [Mangrovibacter sp. MFB070]|nr:hypothetical protein DT73_00310 [Mangrovibacter sp. MFB070]